jgi:hypothetical protein
MDDHQRKQKLAELASCERYAEKAYDEMYEAHSLSGAIACCSEAKEGFYDAIRIAHELGLEDEVRRLEARLEHVKTVLRSQFG